MYAAIEILEKSWMEAQAMQSSPSATNYCNQIKMAINLLKKHTAKLEESIEKELQKQP